MTVNKAILVGNLGRDPEIIHTNSGTTICKLAVATTRKWMDKKTNEKREETEWHRVVVFGQQAEHCGNYLSKGRQVYIEGRIKTDKYTDKDGVEKFATEVVADTVQFLGGRDSGGGGGQRGGSSGGGHRAGGGAYDSGGNGGAYGGGGYSQPPAGGGSYDDDIPF